MRLLPFIIAIGIALAGYAWYVELRLAESERLGLIYKPVCDIGLFSCSKVFSSKYGSVSQLFGLPKVSNAIVGVLFYMLELLFEPNTRILFWMSLAGVFASIGLFTLLTVVMRDFCIVCFSVYVVNFTTFFVAWRRYSRLNERHHTDHPPHHQKKHDDHDESGASIDNAGSDKKKKKGGIDDKKTTTPTTLTHEDIRKSPTVNHGNNKTPVDTHIAGRR